MGGWNEAHSYFTQAQMLERQHRAQRMLEAQRRAAFSGWRPCNLRDPRNHAMGHVPGFTAEHPSQYELVELRREGEATSWVARWDDLPEQLNIANLWWRPWLGDKVDGPIIDATAEEVATQALPAPV